MAVDSDEVWHAMIVASDDLAAELGLDDAPFSPRSLAAVDRWVGEHDGPLDDEDVARLGMFLARLLVETHRGGLVVIQQKDHPLDGERAVTGFARGLANDYHVPFMISAARIAGVPEGPAGSSAQTHAGAPRSLTAREWYDQIRREGT